MGACRGDSARRRVVFTQLGKAFVLGIVAYGYAIVVSVAALLIAIAIAAYTSRSRAAA